MCEMWKSFSRTKRADKNRETRIGYVMMSVSTKLTLLVLALPISILILLDSIIFYFYETGIEVSALLSAILVFLLVWERLRDSLSKRLEYLHKNYLFELYRDFSRSIFHFWKPTVERIRPDLERYGKFMGIFSLYPRNLLKKIDSFLTCCDEFDNRINRIQDIGKKAFVPLDRDLWYHLLGLKHLRDAELQKYAGKPVFKLYADKARKVGKEQVELIEEIKKLLEEGEKMRIEIFEKLEDFLKSNNLKLEEEPSYLYR